MSNLIVTTVLAHLPQQKKTPSSWVSFNAPCCVHNGESADKRKRGGIKVSGGNVSYHCFNCGYKASYQQGRKVTGKFRKWMGWLGVPDDTVKKLVIEAMRYQEDEQQLPQKKEIRFNVKKLQKTKFLLHALETETPERLQPFIDYLDSRGIGVDWYPFAISDNTYAQMDKRLIIPFYYKDRIVGHTGRLVVESSAPKYFTDSQQGYVFNLDAQDWQRKYVIVTEGPFDAIGVDGISILGSEVNDKQIDLINQLGRQVVVVPDRDQTGKKLIEQVTELGWSVSFPQWEEHVNDTAQAVKEYGRVYTLRSIIKGVESNTVKIKLKVKKYV